MKKKTIHAKKKSVLDRRLERLVQQGKLIPPKKTGPIPHRKPLGIGGLVEQLLADRRDLPANPMWGAHDMKELTFGVKELQAHLGTALRAVREGKRVVICSRNEPVAEIVTVRKPVKKMSALDRRLERLVQQGKLNPPRKPGPIPPFKGIPMPGLLKQFLADRR